MAIQGEMFFGHDKRVREIKMYGLRGDGWKVRKFECK